VQVDGEEICVLEKLFMRVEEGFSFDNEGALWLGFG